MPPIKLSLMKPGGDEPDTVHLDEDLVTRFREVVDRDPDLTLEEALRQGLQHVIDTHGAGGGGRGAPRPM